MKIGKDNKEEDLLKNEEPVEVREEKPNFRSRLESFWYFYKWHTLVTVILIIGIGISLIQLVGDVDPDAYIMYVGQGTLYAVNKDKMAETAENYIYDYNNDGKKHLGILEITVAVGDDIPYTAYETNSDAKQRFATEVAAGDTVIYLLEESFYETVASQGILTRLTDIIDADDIPEHTYDEYAVRVSELDFFKQEGYSSVPDDILLCIRQSPENDELSYGRTTEYWNCNKALFVKMFSYKSSAEKTIKAYSPSGKDTYIMYAGYEKVCEKTGVYLAGGAQKYLADTDNDGEIEIGLDYCIINSEYDSASEDGIYFDKQVAESKIPIFILEQSYYEQIKKSGRLVSIETVLGSESGAVQSEDGYGIKLANLDFFKDVDYFNTLNKEYIICFADNKNAADDKFYSNSLEFFKKILQYKSKKTES